MENRNGATYETSVGRLLAQAREIEGLSQSELAETLGGTPATVKRWERGVGSMKLSHLRTISVVLDLDLNCWLGSHKCGQ